MSDELFDKGVKHAPDNYRKLCEPFESLQATEKALEAFWEEFYELRNKHKIADVLIIYRVNCLDSDGVEGVVTGKFHCGNVELSEGMSAMAYGQAVVERQERMARNLEGMMTKKKDRR